MAEGRKPLQITLKAARKNVGLTQEKASKLLGVSAKTLGNWENARTFPEPPDIAKIEQLYGVSYADIIFLPINYG